MSEEFRELEVEDAEARDEAAKGEIPEVGPNVDTSDDAPLEVAIVPAVPSGPADRPEDHPEPVADSPQEVILGTDVPVVHDPRLEGSEADLEFKPKELSPPEREDAPARVRLPDEAFNSDGYKAANAAARDAFSSVVLRPGYIYPDHGGRGRYVNIFDLEDVYELKGGDLIPDGLFLIGTNVLLRDEEREDRLRRG